MVFYNRKHVKNHAYGSPVYCIPLLIIAPCLVVLIHTDVDKVHHRVGRLIKVYEAYLKALPRSLIMLSAKVSGRGEGWRGRHRQR